MRINKKIYTVYPHDYINISKCQMLDAYDICVTVMIIRETSVESSNVTAYGMGMKDQIRA